MKLTQFVSKGNAGVVGEVRVPEAVKNAGNKVKDAAVTTGNFLADSMPAHRGMVKAVELESKNRDRELMYYVMDLYAKLGLEMPKDKKDILEFINGAAEKEAANIKAEKEAKKEEKKAAREAFFSRVKSSTSTGVTEDKEESTIPPVAKPEDLERIMTMLFGSQEEVEQEVVKDSETLSTASKSVKKEEEASSPSKEEKPKEEAPKKNNPSVPLLSPASESEYIYDDMGETAK